MVLSRNILLRMQKETIEQLAAKWDKVNISFYFFYDNANTRNTEVMEVATWWIQKHDLPHFVKAIKILELIEIELRPSYNT